MNVCITVNQFSFLDLSKMNLFERTNFRDEDVDYLNNCFPETFNGRFAERKNCEPREIFSHANGTRCTVFAGCFIHISIR